MSTINKNNPFKLGLLVLTSLLIACSWLAMPYFFQGPQLMQNVGNESRNIRAGNISLYLTRQLINTSDIEITATLASSEYFQFVDRANIISELRPDKNIIFFLNETIHRGELPTQLPKAVLHIGEKTYLPNFEEGPRNVEHHRMSIFSFPKITDDGEIIDLSSSDRIRLYISNPYLGSEKDMTFVASWDLPYSIPPEIKTNSYITPIAMLALGAGLLSSVLTPCLLQLVIVFSGVIAGFSTIPSSQNNSSFTSPIIRKKVLNIAIFFVIGFVLLYAIAGAVIGAIGNQAQLLFAEYSRLVSIISGMIVIFLGLWVGIRGRQNLTCSIKGSEKIKELSNKDSLAAIIASMGYALGCTACFGGAIVATLIVYVGAIGSALIGAGIMLAFAVGVAVPFLLSALYISKSKTIISFLSQNSRYLSILSMIIIITFGLILITDNFHTVSDLIYPYLGLT
ncbi:MAG: hypothetical protein CBC38_04215 [Gammaproteobacteria bacterium TMED78]|nr:MAG: hypothetical protein CBC38_04215 [Gammaproteobacteria bacterium TMED78]|tara:strand:+ start:105147 stop:106505 length:1359 start_codon:yes stop_codon:yes gene_type:complete